MSPHTNGLARDLNLIRRRAWLFIPFLVLGILVAFAFSSLAGESTAVATIQLETAVHNLVEGGDRGLRIFDVESMTRDERFEAKVLEEIGDASFDYSRFKTTLMATSVTEGTSRGNLTVTIADRDKAAADAYRDAWMTVFEREYTSPDGLFRTRFIEKTGEVAREAEARYAEAFAAVQRNHPELALDELVRSPDQRGFSLVEELSRQEAELQRQLAEVQGAISSGQVNGAVASAILGTTVADAQAQSALEGRRAALQAAIAALREQRAAYSDGNLAPEVRAEIDNLRALADLRHESYVRWNNAQVAATSAESNFDTTYTFSGGLAASVPGRVAVVLAVTVVFGLIAIYAVEWLSQVRTGVAERETA